MEPLILFQALREKRISIYGEPGPGAAVTRFGDGPGAPGLLPFADGGPPLFPFDDGHDPPLLPFADGGPPLLPFDDGHDPPLHPFADGPGAPGLPPLRDGRRPLLLRFGDDGRQRRSLRSRFRLVSPSPPLSQALGGWVVPRGWGLRKPRCRSPRQTGPALADAACVALPGAI